MTAAELLRDPIEAIGARLAGARVDHIEQLRGGRNSRVWRVVAGGQAYALKLYPEDNIRDRVGTEVAALELMAAHGIDCVPRVVAFDRRERAALLTWAEGARIGQVVESDMDQAIAFLRSLRPLRDFPLSHRASEACLSGSDIEGQILKRLTRLRSVDDAPELHALLDGPYTAALVRGLHSARSALTPITLPFNQELDPEHRVLVPADFGFHNALRDVDGRQTFIDFEYFGWDDPVKLVADFLLHPGTPVADGLRTRLRAAAEGLYGDDPHFRIRLDAYYPLFGLRWVLILLNEFLADGFGRRQHAGAAADRAGARATQLAKARAMLHRVSQGKRP